jgi:hypothetical protein
MSDFSRDLLDSSRNYAKMCARRSRVGNWLNGQEKRPVSLGAHPLSPLVQASGRSAAMALLFTPHSL